MTNAKHIVAEIHVHKVDGCYHFFSDEIPGFNLCGPDLEALKNAIPAAIEFFYKRKFDQVVSVERAVRPSALLTSQKASPKLRPERVVMQPTFACA